MSAGTAVIHAAGYASDIGPHVFPVAKFRLLRERLLADGDLDRGAILEPAPATRDELLLVHTPEYLEDLEALRLTHRTLYSELPLEHDIVRAYILAAGGTTRAARM